MEGLEEFEGLDPYRGYAISIGVNEINDTWEREGYEDNDVFDTSSSEKTESHIFDNIYLSRKSNKLAFIGVGSDPKVRLFLPFHYKTTKSLSYKRLRRDITWKIEYLSVGDIKIRIPDERREKLDDSIDSPFGRVSYKNHGDGEDLIDKTLKLPMNFDELPKCAGEIYPIF